ncbi:hypothetical protein D3C80_1627430 [compost metagenome]
MVLEAFLRQRVQGLQGRQGVEVELLFRLADVGVALLYHRQVHVFLVAEVVVQHALGAAHLGRDALQACAVVAVIGELRLAGLQQGAAHVRRRVLR